MNRLTYSDLTDADLATLRKVYAPDEIPPCRICGGPLSIQRMGGGAATVWGCDGWEEDPDSEGRLIRQQGRTIADQHYSDSRWTQLRPGDSRALRVLDALEDTITERDRLGRQVLEFRRKCDPGESHVLVTADETNAWHRERGE